MKLPKNRATVYAVMRERTDEVLETVVGVFSNYDDAEDYAGACEQQFLERAGIVVRFTVVLSTFYG